VTTRNDEGQVMKLIRPSADAEHGYAREQLPWYLAQALDAQAERRVREHLEVCESCRESCSKEAAWVAAMREAPVVDLAPQAALSRVVTRIAARERRRAQLALLLRPWAALKNTRTLAFATAIQAAAIVGLVFVVGVLMRREPTVNEFRALSNASTARRSDAPQLRLVFDDRLTSIEIRQLLDRVGGQIVEGPGPRGIFTVALVQPADANGDEAQAAVQWLRAHPGVRLAEIVSH
jgi:hypothetical protein